MLVKSVIAGTVLSLMAGGVVYFGTDVDAGELTEKVAAKTSELSDKVMAGGAEHPHDKKVKAEKSADMPSVKTASGKTIEAKAPTVSYGSGDKKKTVKTAEGSSDDAPQKKWLNQYLKTEKADKKAENPADASAEAKDKGVAKDLMESMGLTKEGSEDSDTGTFIITEEEIETAEAKGFEERVLETENIWTEDDADAKQAERRMLSDILKKRSDKTKDEASSGEKKLRVEVIKMGESESRTETETVDMGDGKTMKIVTKTVKSKTTADDLEDMDIRIFTQKDGSGGISAAELKAMTHSKDISATVKVVMEQAKKIEMPELRDRAYLDLVSYALKHGDYDVARQALNKVEQVELRDTARNRIAISYAQDGNAAKAFGILDELEVDALRDVMRLQVIEAMIAPEEVPQGME